MEQSIPQRFEKIVAQFPDRLAIKVGARALTYEELNKSAHRIARVILAEDCVTRKQLTYEPFPKAAG
jgi:non-ribosomal peptide synthetase component F